MKLRYKGLFGLHARRRCPHSGLIGIYGDEINSCGGYRLYCEDCDRFLDGPVLLTANRYCERGTRPGVQEIDFNEYKFIGDPDMPSLAEIYKKSKEELNAKDAT